MSGAATVQIPEVLLTLWEKENQLKTIYDNTSGGKLLGGYSGTNKTIQAVNKT